MAPSDTTTVHNDKITFVVTSCGRPELLARTLRTFVEHNTYPIARYVLVEDSGDHEMRNWLEREYGTFFDLILFNEPRLGQIKSVDRAYSVIDTPYIFHCEDDFEFFRPGFVEESLSVLKHDRKAVTVWMRSLWDCKKHKLGERIQYTPDRVMYRELLPKVSHKETWYGFTFNPGLRRLEDYELVKPFNALGHELEINYAYHNLGFHGLVLEEGATRHIGAGHHVSDVGEPWHRRIRVALRRRRRARRERKAYR